MEKFKRIVAVEPVNLTDVARARLAELTDELVFYPDRPAGTTALIGRMQGADGVLVSYLTQIPAEAIGECAGTLRYIGMCCSLYTPESANVDIHAANAQGVVVKGVLDYGDEGVPEYVIYTLVQYLHGFGPKMWREQPQELTRQRVGVLGMGTTGRLVGRALRFFGAEVSYFSRTRKPAQEAEEGFVWRELDDLLRHVDILCTCLNKNVILLGERELAMFTGNKILVNISIGPGHDVAALAKWLDGGNTAFGDTPNAIDPTGGLLTHPNVTVTNKGGGRTAQASVRLGEKVLNNIEEFLNTGK